MLTRALLLAALPLAALAPAAGAAERLDVSVRDTGQLVFTDSRGRTVLAQTGSLTFRSAAGRFLATRVVSRRRDRVTLATSDPSGRRIELRLRTDGPGGIALTARPTGSGVTSILIGFGARPAERYLGFGERSNSVDQRGNEVES